jgi:hypothetical protein
VRLEGNLGKNKATKLLSGLHGNTPVTQLELIKIGLGRTGCGALILSDFLQHNSTVTKLYIIL